MRTFFVAQWTKACNQCLQLSFEELKEVKDLRTRKRLFDTISHTNTRYRRNLHRNRKYVKLFALRKSDFVFFACLVCKQCLDLVCLCSWGGKRSRLLFVVKRLLFVSLPHRSTLHFLLLKLYDIYHTGISELRLLLLRLGGGSSHDWTLDEVSEEQFLVDARQSLAA